MKKNNKKGFTLAELLIVVAIIAVLVAVAIPVFTAQLHKAQDATEIANARSLYAERQADFLSNAGNASYKADTTNNLNGKALEFKNGSCSVTFDSAKGYTVTWTPGTNCTSCGNEEQKWGAE